LPGTCQESANLSASGRESAKNNMKNKIILIGGAPVAGKTFLAEKLSRELKIPWISTDSIRTIIKKFADKNKYPALFCSTGITAEEYLSKYTPKQIVFNENKESAIVWKAARAFIDSRLNEECSYIIEGIAVLPSLVYKNYKNNKLVKPIFLIDKNEDRIRKIIYTRGLWDDADKYSDDVKGVEVEWAIEFNKWLEKEVEKYKLPFVEIKKRKNLIKEIKKNIK